jgi:hypothetical protein
MRLAELLAGSFLVARSEVNERAKEKYLKNKGVRVCRDKPGW